MYRLLYEVCIVWTKKRLKFLDNKFMLCCIHTSNLRVHTSIFTVYEKKLVKVSVRKNFGVIMNSFSQFYSTFIRKHSRFFVRVGHKPKSIVYKVCTYMSSGNLFFSLSSSEEYLWIFWKKYLKQLFVKMYQFLSALTLPCPYSSPKMFCASPKLWLHLVPFQKLVLQPFR